MPQPRAVYESIARACSSVEYVRDPDQPGQMIRRGHTLTAAGVNQLDVLLQATKGESDYEAALDALRLDGQPLPPQMIRAALQLRTARETGLLT